MQSSVEYRGRSYPLEQRSPHLPKDEMRYFLTAYEVARFCGVPTEEVLGWIDAGMLAATYLPVGRYRITVHDFLVFMAGLEPAVEPADRVC